MFVSHSQGQRVAVIAAALGLSPVTVRKYLATPSDALPRLLATLEHREHAAESGAPRQ